MKPQTLTVFIAFAALTATAGLVMNPISWTYDEDSRTLTTDGTSSFALADVSLAREVVVAANVRPMGAGTNGWATLGKKDPSI
jgi:hypothetical protein